MTDLQKEIVKKVRRMKKIEKRYLTIGELSLDKFRFSLAALTKTGIIKEIRENGSIYLVEGGKNEV